MPDTYGMPDIICSSFVNNVSKTNETQYQRSSQNYGHQIDLARWGTSQFCFVYNLDWVQTFVVFALPFIGFRNKVMRSRAPSSSTDLKTRLSIDKLSYLRCIPAWYNHWSDCVKMWFLLLLDLLSIQIRDFLTILPFCCWKITPPTPNRSVAKARKSAHTFL